MSRKGETSPRKGEQQLETEQEIWAEAVAQLLGPVLASDKPQRRRTHALWLAHEALCAAGEAELAKEVHELI